MSNLYEFKVERHYEGGGVRTTPYQCPANSESDALIAVGRAFNNELYTVKVASRSLIRIGEGTEMYNFRKLAAQMTKEFDEEQGNITCEFSTSADDMLDKWQILRMNQPKFGHWTMGVCGVCLENSPTHIIHCEIVKND